MAGPCTLFRGTVAGTGVGAAASGAGVPASLVTTPLPPGVPRSDTLPVSGISIQFVPAGKFGTGTRDPSRDIGAFQVEITRSFWMCTTEISRDQWDRIMQDGRLGWKGSQLPATNITWEEAVACAERLGKLEGRTVRLPTEAEWELACRAGTRTDYWWGDAPLRSHDNFGGRVGGAPEPVGYGHANPLGLFNMHGNVREMCLDWYTNWSGGVDPLCEDREQSERDMKRLFSTASRVTRGGDFFVPPGSGAASVRATVYAQTPMDYIGVRFIVEEDFNGNSR